MFDALVEIRKAIGSNLLRFFLVCLLVALLTLLFRQCVHLLTLTKEGKFKEALKANQLQKSCFLGRRNCICIESLQPRCLQCHGELYPPQPMIGSCHTSSCPTPVISFWMMPSSENRPTHVTSIAPVPFITAVPDNINGFLSIVFLTSSDSPVNADSSHDMSDPRI